MEGERGAGGGDEKFGAVVDGDEAVAGGWDERCLGPSMMSRALQWTYEWSRFREDLRGRGEFEIDEDGGSGDEPVVDSSSVSDAKSSMSS